LNYSLKITKRVFIGVFIILAGSSLLATGSCQTQADGEFISFNQPIIQNGQWKVKLEDNADFKSPTYDDSGWSMMDEVACEQKELPVGPGYIWYRKRIYLPPGKPFNNLGLKMDKVGAIDETYVNGHLVGSSGLINQHYLDGEKIRIYQIPNYILVFGGENLVAVRVRHIDRAEGTFTGKITIGDYDTLFRGMLRKEAVDLIVCGIFMAVGVLAIILFIIRSLKREYLFFGLGTIGMAIYSFYMTQWKYILDLEWFPDYRVYYAGFFLVVPCFVRFIYEIWPSRKSENTKRAEDLFGYFSAGLVVYAICLDVAPIFISDMRIWTFIDLKINDVVIVLASFVTLMYVFYKVYKGEGDGRIMLAGLVIGFGGGVTEMVGAYMNFPRNIAMWGVGVFILAMAIVLARRFFRLQAKVQQYSACMEQLVEKRTKQIFLLEQSRRRMFANISHDLRTPVSSVLGHVELLLEDITESPEQQKTYLKRIQAKMLGLNRLIQDLFELAKLEAYETSFQMMPITVEDLVRNVYQKYKFDINNAGFGFELKLPIPETVVEVDVGRLDQVFANLFSNAIRYMGHDGVIIISCRLVGISSDVAVMFCVADNGVGIAPDDRPYVFERFYRASEARETSTENSGLGLAIAKEIIEVHGGSIWVDEGAGQGCVICFTLPMVVNG